MAASEPTYTWFQKTRPLKKGLDTVFVGPNTNPQKRLWFSTPNKLINLNDTKRILHKRGCVLVLKNENSVIWENLLQTSHFELSHHAQHTHIHAHARATYRTGHNHTCSWRGNGLHMHLHGHCAQMNCALPHAWPESNSQRNVLGEACDATFACMHGSHAWSKTMTVHYMAFLALSLVSEMMEKLCPNMAEKFFIFAIQKTIAEDFYNFQEALKKSRPSANDRSCLRLKFFFVLCKRQLALSFVSETKKKLFQKYMHACI